MTNKEKMLLHIAEAEKWQARAVAEEEAARLRAIKHGHQSLGYATSKELEHYAYQQATGNRNAHQQQALMYGIAALVELTG